MGLVDLLRSLLLVPLAFSILSCKLIYSCNILETSFLVLVTASTINLLTSVMNDAPVLPDEDDEDALPMLMDSPQCVWFGIFVIWFASITVNLGPTFLSGIMAANVNHRPREPSCPIVQGPYRHYILNFLWILINLLCVLLTLYHLVKLHRDYTTTSPDAVRVATLVTATVTIDGEGSEASDPASSSALVPPAPCLPDWQLHRKVLEADPVKVRRYLSRVRREGTARVKMFFIVTVAYLLFWGPLFVVTLVNWHWHFEEAKQSMAHEVTLHVALVHSFVNPTLFIVLHKGLRQATWELLSCFFCRNAGNSQVGSGRAPGGSGRPTAAENRAFIKASISSSSSDTPAELRISTLK